MLLHVEHFGANSKTFHNYDSEDLFGEVRADHYYLECRKLTNFVSVKGIELPDTYWVSASFEQVSAEKRTYGFAFGKGKTVRAALSVFGNVSVVDSRPGNERTLLKPHSRAAIREGTERRNTLCVAVSPTTMTVIVNGEVVAAVDQAAGIDPIDTSEFRLHIDEGVHIKIHELIFGEGNPQTLPLNEPLRATARRADGADVDNAQRDQTQGDPTQGSEPATAATGAPPAPPAPPSLTTGFSCVVGTDAATIVMFHPEDLTHHAQTDIAWIYDTSKARDDFSNGHLLGFSPGNDGGFGVRVTNETLTEEERNIAGSSEEFRVSVQHGRLFIGNEDHLPGLEQMSDPNESSSGWFDIDNGEYRVTVNHIKRWEAKEEARQKELPDYVLVFEPITNPYLVVAPASAPTIK